MSDGAIFGDEAKSQTKSYEIFVPLKTKIKSIFFRVGVVTVKLESSSMSL